MRIKKHYSFALNHYADNEEALERKTENNPINRAGQVRGNLLFYWNHANINLKGAKLILSIKDQCGKEYKLEEEHEQCKTNLKHVSLNHAPIKFQNDFLL